MSPPAVDINRMDIGAWAYAVQAEHEAGRPIWVFLADHPEAAKVTRATTLAYRDAILPAYLAVVAADLLAEMRAAAGYLRNAKIDLETGCTKVTAIRTIEGGLARLEAAIAASQPIGESAASPV